MGTKNDPGKYDCHGAADPDEPLFTLRAKDPHAPDLVRRWAAAYTKETADGILAGVCTGDEIAKRFDKAAEALTCADEMEWWALHGERRPPQLGEAECEPWAVDSNYLSGQKTLRETMSGPAYFIAVNPSGPTHGGPVDPISDEAAKFWTPRDTDSS